MAPGSGFGVPERLFAASIAGAAFSWGGWRWSKELCLLANASINPEIPVKNIHFFPAEIRCLGGGDKRWPIVFWLEFDMIEEAIE